MTASRHRTRPREDLDEFFPQLVGPGTLPRAGVGGRPGPARVAAALLLGVGVLWVSVLLGRSRG